ncbi:MAG: hypothetical protein Q9169_005702 [Polycauliona sp. 2 TL-2023]
MPDGRLWKLISCFPGRIPKQSSPQLVDEPSQNESEVDVQPAHGKCRFLHRLPPEIRLLVYDYLFRDHVYHLRRIPTAFQTINNHPYPSRSPEIWSPPYAQMSDHPLFPRRLQPPQQAVTHPLLEMFRNKPTSWAMLLTCCQIYHETVGLFYSAATLRFNNPHVLLHLAAEHLRAGRISAVKHLDIVWKCSCVPWYFETPAIFVDHPQVAWDAMWRLIANDMQLSSVTICIVFKVIPTRSDIRTSWIRPMFRIKGIPKFQVRLRHDPHVSEEAIIDKTRVLNQFSKDICNGMNENGNNYRRRRSSFVPFGLGIKSCVV